MQQDGRSSRQAPGNESRRGFATRAIRAATRSPRVVERPYNVPIYQTVTFATEDSETLGDVLNDRRAGYAYSRLDKSTRFDAQLSRGWRALELTVAGDNLSDVASYDQCGLPQPGRVLRIQLTVR